MFGESKFESLMQEIILDAKDKNISSIGEEGALIVRFEDKKRKRRMPPAMLVKSDGSTTYFTRDLATICKRIRHFRDYMEPKWINSINFFLVDVDRKFDSLIYEIGGEQKLHMRQVFATAKKLWPEETKNVEFVHVAHGTFEFARRKDEY